MHDQTIQSLSAQLALKQRQLDMVLALDRIRDRATTPSAMFADIVNLLTNEFGTGLCLMALVNPETKGLEQRAVNLTDVDLLPDVNDLLNKVATYRQLTIGDATFSANLNLPAQLHVAVMPIVMHERDYLGLVLLCRAGQPFDAADGQLLEIAESLIDSAIIQAYQQQQTEQYLKELEAIYKIDSIRDHNDDFDEMLYQVLYEVCHATNSEAGFVMLYDNQGEQLELRAITRSTLNPILNHQQELEAWAKSALDVGKLIYSDSFSGDLHDAMCLPLVLDDHILGLLGVVNHHSRSGFGLSERRLMTAIGSQIDTAIFENLEQRRLRQVLSRSVDPKVMERLLNHPNIDFLRGERMTLTVLFADIRGSTALTQRTDPELLVGYLNHCFTQMTDLIFDEGGTLDKFIGDEVMALFGAPFHQADHALRAVRTALRIQQAHAEVMDAWRLRGMKPAPLGIGLATGELIVGEMGSPQRSDFTVIGATANLGSRICGVTPAHQVYICPTTYQHIAKQADVTPILGMNFKGFDAGMPIYRIEGLHRL